MKTLFVILLTFGLAMFYCSAYIRICYDYTFWWATATEFLLGGFGLAFIIASFCVLFVLFVNLFDGA